MVVKSRYHHHRRRGYIVSPPVKKDPFSPAMNNPSHLLYPSNVMIGYPHPSHPDSHPDSHPITKAASTTRTPGPSGTLPWRWWRSRPGPGCVALAVNSDRRRAGSCCSRPGGLARWRRAPELPVRWWVRVRPARRVRCRRRGRPGRWFGSWVVWGRRRG